LTLHQHEYQCAESVMTSDHRPVYGVFTLETRLTSENISSPSIQNGRILLFDLLITQDVEDNFPMKRPPTPKPVANSECYVVFRAPFLPDGVSKPLALPQYIS